MAEQNFIDYVKVCCKSGDGGADALSQGEVCGTRRS
jgi:GTPase involved in cell partitioning and DNA repair